MRRPFSFWLPMCPADSLSAPLRAALVRRFPDGLQDKADDVARASASG